MSEALKKELTEYEALVDEIKGDCDKCKMTCRDRLVILDHQIQRQEKAFQRFEVMIESVAEILAVSHPDSFQRKLNELTARILANTGEANEADRNIRRLYIE